MWSCAPGYFHVDIFSIFRVIALDLVKICNFQLVSHVTQKIFDLELWNLTGMLISMCSCAPGYFLVNKFSIFRVIALDLVKICNFQLVSHVTKKVFDLQSWNLIRMLLSMSSCAPGYFHVDIFSCFFLSYCPWLTKNLQNLTCAAHNSKSLWPVGLKVYKNVGQHVTYAPWGFLVALFSICSVCPLLNKRFLVFNLGTCSQKKILT
jgi:hypothetical protein